MAGKVSSATEFSTKTVPSDTDISSSVAPVIGPTAAIALPPQIAVPVEIRNAGRALHREQLAQQRAQRHRKRDADCGVKKAALAGLDYFLQVHAEAESDDRGLQQKLGILGAMVRDKDEWRSRRRAIRLAEPAAATPKVSGRK